MINKFTTQNFEEEVKKYNGTVLVDFYADWCGPCRMMSPVVDEISNENPTLIIFKNGEIAKTFVGVTPKEEIEENLK